MSETDTASPSFDPAPLSWVMAEIREALGRSRTALFEAGGLEPEYQATALRLAKSHLQQAHGALQMGDVQGMAAITQVAEEALDRFKDGSVKCSADNAQAVGRLYGALVEYLEELLDGAPQQPARLFPYYAAVQQMLGASRIHPADLFFPDLAREPELPGAAAQDVDYGALRQRFERALLPYLKSGDPEGARPLAGVIAEVAGAQAVPRGRVFWLALQAFAELVAEGHVPGGVYVKQLFGAANLQMRRLAQGAPEYPDAVLRDALFFIAATEPDHLVPLARDLRAGFALDGTVPADYTAERYCRPEAQPAQDAPPRQDDGEADVAQQVKAALRDVERILADGADPARLADLDGTLHPLEGALAGAGQPDAQAAVAHVREQLAALASGAGTGDPAERDRIAQNVEALGFFADMLAQNAAGARERFAFDAAQGAFRAVPLRKIPGAESIPVLDDEVPPPATPEGQAGPLAGIAAVPGASDPAIEEELLEIFIGEAREMLAFIESALAKPRLEAGAPDALALLRRSFNTLKGSGRMVGLNQFADAAAALEKVLNAWLAEGRPANEALFGLLGWTAAEFDGWVGELAAKGISPRGAAPVVTAAAQVLEGGPFVSPDDRPPPVEPPPAGPYVTDENATEESAAAAPEMGATAAPESAGPDGMRFAGRLAVPAPQFDTFVAEAAALAGALARHFEFWRRQGELDADALHLAHALTDMAGTVGFKPLRELAAALEATLQAVPATLHDPAQHDLFDLVVQRAGEMVDGFAAGDMPPDQPELIAALERLRDELARAHAAGPDIASRLDGMLAAPREAPPVADEAPHAAEAAPFVADEAQPAADEALFAAEATPPVADETSPEVVEAPPMADETPPEGDETPSVIDEAPSVIDEAPPVADDLATRLDTLFADTYHALLADPPPVPERGAPLPLRPQLATQDESIDDLFDAAFDDAFAAPPLTQAAPQLTLVQSPERPAQPAMAGAQDAGLPGTTIDLAIDRARLESEVDALRAALAGFEDKLGALRQQLREVEAQAESHIASRLSVSGQQEFDPAEFDRVTRLKELTRTMAGGVEDMASFHAGLQRSAEAIAGLLPGQGGAAER